MLRLVLPQKKYARSYVQALKELKKVSQNVDLINEEIKNADKHIKKIQFERRHKIPNNTNEFWLVDGKEYIGTIQIRHKPSGKYPNLRSHIFYEIRPSKYHKGYGTLILKLGLRKAIELGFKSITIVCRQTNNFSKKIIEKNSGQFIRNVNTPEGTYLKYIINL